MKVVTDNTTQQREKKSVNRRRNRDINCEDCDQVYESRPKLNSYSPTL